MTFTKVTNTGIGSTGTVLLQNLDVIGVTTVGGGVSAVNGFFSGITTFANATDSTSSTTGSVIVSGGVGIAGSLNVGGSVSVGGTLTYEDVTNVDSVGIITARSNILVGSGITLSPDGDVFATGVSTFSGNVHIDTDVDGENNRLLIGSSTVRAVGASANSSFIQIEGTNTNSSSMSLIDNQNSTQSPVIRFGKSRGTSVGSTVSVADGDSLGKITFAGADGDDMQNNTAQIKVQVCNRYSGGATVGINSIPTDIAFETSSSNGTNREERLRITGDGRVGIGTTNPQMILHLEGGANSGIFLGNTAHGYKLRANVSGSNDYGFLIEDEDGVDLYRATSSTGTNATDTHIWSTAGSERLRIASAGQIGIAGANYGTDNQVLTSQGSSSAVEWRGINTPMWDSYQTSATSIPTGSWTLISNLSEQIDTDGAFASNTFTVPAGGAGTYFIYGYATIDDVQAADIVLCGITINAGSAEPANVRRGSFGTSGTANSRISAVYNGVVNLSVGDEVRLSVYHNEGSTEPTEPYYTKFGGYRLSV